MDGGTTTNFVRRYWVSEVEYLDMSARGPDHEHLVLHIHGVTSFLEFHSSQWGGRSEVPILDSGEGVCFPASVTMCWEKKKGQTKEKQRIEPGVKKGGLVPSAFCPSYP